MSVTVSLTENAVTVVPAVNTVTVASVGTQGIQGATGADGAVVESVAFSGDDMVFTLSDATTATLVGAKTDLKGDTGATGAATFLELTDTPSTFTAGKWLKVNTGGTALEWVDEPAGSYTLPTASDSVLGGVKVGTGLSITDGVLSATGGSGTDAATVNSLVFAQTY